MLIQNLKWQAFYAAAMASACWLHYNAELYPQAALLGAAGLWGLLGPVPFMQGKTLHGSARWASRKDAKARGLLGRSGVIVGKLKGRFGDLDSRFLRFDAPDHLATFAPTRSGKGAGQIIPTLLSYPGSVFVTDIKRENFDVTAAYRADKLGQQVVRIDPSNPAPGVIFNPLDCVRRDDSMATDAGVLADLLMPRSSNGGASDHFDQQALILVRGLIMYVIDKAGPDACIALVRQCLMAGPERFEGMLSEMASSAVPEISEAGNHMQKLAAKSPREFGSVLSTAVGKTDIWSDRQVKAITTGRSTVDFGRMKEAGVSVYLVVPPDQIGHYRVFMRTVVGMAVRAMTQSAAKPDNPVLFLLDEFPALGHMASIEQGIGVVAGYGVRFWIFCQDMPQLRAIYREGAGTLMANCAVRSFFGVTALETADYISRSLGRGTVETQNQSARVAGAGLVATDATVSRSMTARDLLTADEVAAMPEGKQIILVQGLRPLMADEVRYFEDRAFRGLYGVWKRG